MRFHRFSAYETFCLGARKLLLGKQCHRPQFSYFGCVLASIGVPFPYRMISKGLVDQKRQFTNFAMYIFYRQKAILSFTKRKIIFSASFNCLVELNLRFKIGLFWYLNPTYKLKFGGLSCKNLARSCLITIFYEKLARSCKIKI